MTPAENEYERVVVAPSLGVYHLKHAGDLWLSFFPAKFVPDLLTSMVPAQGTWAEWVALAHAILERERDQGFVAYVAVVEVPDKLPMIKNILVPDAPKGLVAPRVIPTGDFKPGDLIMLDIVVNREGEILEIIPRRPRDGELVDHPKVAP